MAKNRKRPGSLLPLFSTQNQLHSIWTEILKFEPTRKVKLTQIINSLRKFHEKLQNQRDCLTTRKLDRIGQIEYDVK